ncbi:excinuclease ABC subunit UvrC [Alpinimonas psychrophila]|uniref:UvrABC system protein C n=1 Tax=Alpinimonas psychrophila TaxID=748908 RepID=A0A7W3PNI1_9MICO|nr:excinuclease ABC subunit UvrC [Alpinimonas psychrophila]MBA8828482.1 excinuclease ABC subunit C [Alpinimonas psychrophila]
MADMLSYRPKTGDIPTNPGVYRFRDATARILYVGKAKNLRARLTSYFAPLEKLHERTRRMVTSAASVEWTVVRTEFEALQLEFTWIKEFEPPFNIQFRDDKSYPYLALTLGEKVPRVLITRNHKIPNARYFGPYTKTWAIRETLDLILPVFPMRSCSDGIYKKAEAAKRPCLLGDIGRCAAPCAGRVTPEEHRSIALDLSAFMSGKNDGHLKQLKQKMFDASENQDYEGAAKYRDNIAALETVASKSSVVLPEEVDADVFGLARDELSAAVQQFIVRGGRVRGVRSWTVDIALDVEDGELVDNMLRVAYETEDSPPRDVIVPLIPDDEDAVRDWLTEIRRERTSDPRAARVKLRVASRGDLAALAATVEKNAKQALMLFKTRRSADYISRSKALAELEIALGLPASPLRIECFDVSHLSGTRIVASMVVFEDGLAKKSDYRKFAIPEARDDTDAMHQVLSRRLAYLTGAVQDPEAPRFSGEIDPVAEGEIVTTVPKKKSFAYPPGLLIVDGGQPQVNAAQRALAEAGLGHIPLVGLAKRLEEVWVAGESYPIILPRNSEGLFLLQQVRDEAHRFAISFQRTSRKRDINTVLNDIPGLGPTRIKKLLSHFGSVTVLKNATVEEIASLSGINHALATTIKDALKA